MKTISRFARTAAALVLALGACSVAAAASSPQALIKETTERLLAAVDEHRQEIRENPSRARKYIDEIVTPHVDLEVVGRWILGRHWRTATPEQRQRFIDEFRMLLIRTYATALTEFTDTEVNYVSERIREDGERALVRTEIPQPGGQPIQVDYRLHSADGEWMLYDVVIEGVSMVSTYRTSFGQEIERKGLDGLIAELEKKNRQNETLDAVLETGG